MFHGPDRSELGTVQCVCNRRRVKNSVASVIRHSRHFRAFLFYCSASLNTRIFQNFIHFHLITIPTLFLKLIRFSCLTLTLLLFCLQEEDYGSYKCVAKNPRGETDGVIHLYSKCRLFAHVLKYPAETFVELMTNRRGECASGSPTIVYSRCEFLNRSLLFLD